jgi:hypothetical protein
MTRIGWIMDHPSYRGGAELDCDALIAAAPSDVEIVQCEPGNIVQDVDGYVVANCTDYDLELIDRIRRRPVMKRIYDMWRHGDSALRDWFLGNSALLLPVSPPQIGMARWKMNAPTVCVPCSVPLDVYERAAADSSARDGAVWIGRMFSGKGLALANDWAKERGVTIDVYGYGPDRHLLGKHLNYCGELAVEAVAETLAQYKTFVFLPTAFDPCPRSVIEAWAAGCELVINANVGTGWWIQNLPEALRDAPVRFWNAVSEAMQ